ncbi:hypothetical protein BDP27DRAFT_1298196 [Rhodocollybia butyracea]|uniref:NmrA-like domain-containing protein n=1 Tax=Rhodocollybia butyracea TaxID=206335 RepID=A0A9P5PLE9_9AGAR|nr:hypothetical protein BDP27DRAFT_1298196 [Rhodocollybia butyracea]
MSTTSAKSIAIIGAGTIGTHILRAFLALPNHPKIVVLTRSNSKPKTLPDDLALVSVPVLPIDYTDVSALTTLFKEHAVDVVICTLPFPAGQKTQFTLAAAAKAAGSVKIFVPSEWSSPTEGAHGRGEKNLWGLKDEFSEHLKSIELPSTRFYTGLFFGAVPWIGALDVSDDFHIIGKGDKVLSVTSETDIGGFVAHVFTNYPLTSPKLFNNSLRIEGQSVTLTEIAEIYGKRITYVPEGGKIPARSAEEAYVKTVLQTAAEDGQLSNGWDRKSWTYSPGLAANANKLWPGHVWRTLESTVEKK